jgi:hypothetical protein
VPLYDDEGNQLTPDEALAYLQGQQPPAPPQQQDPPNWRRDLEARAAQAKVEKERADAAERKLAFAQAGVPLDHPMTEYLVNGYKGEATPDAIKAEAARLGILQPAPEVPQTPQSPVTNPTADQAAVFGRMADATAGQTVPAGRNWDAEKAAAPNMDALSAVLRDQAQAEGRSQPVVVND